MNLQDISILSGENSIYILLISILIISQLFKIFIQRNMYLGIMFNFFGTFLHELAHFLVAIITGAKVQSFTLMPKHLYLELKDKSKQAYIDKRDLLNMPSDLVELKEVSIFRKYKGNGLYKGTALGAVATTTNSFNAFWISLAPLFLLVLDYYIYIYFFEFFERNLLNEIYLICIMSLILINSIPSSADLKVCFKYKLGLIMYITIIYLALDFYKIIPENFSILKLIIG